MSSFNVQSSQGPTSWGRVQAKSPTQVNSTSIGKVQTPVSSPTSDKVSYTAPGYMPKDPNAQHLGSLPMPQGPRFVPMQAQNQAAVKATHAFASQFPSHPPVVQASHQHAAPPPPSYAPPPPSYEETVRQTSTQKAASPAVPKETTTVKGAWTGGQEVKLTKEQNQVLMNTYLKSRAEAKVSSKNTQLVNTFNLSWSGKLNTPPPSYGAEKIIEFSRLTPSEKVQAHADYLLNPNPPSTPTRADPLPKPQGHSYGYNTQEGEEEIHAAVPKSSPAETQRFDYTAPPPDDEGYTSASLPKSAMLKQDQTANTQGTNRPAGASFETNIRVLTGGVDVELTPAQAKALANRYNKEDQDGKRDWGATLQSSNPPSVSDSRWETLSPQEKVLAKADFYVKREAFVNSRDVPPGVLNVNNEPLSQSEWDQISAKWRERAYTSVVLQNRNE